MEQYGQVDYRLALAAALGMSMLASGPVWAESRDDIVNRHAVERERAAVGDSDLTGGFYDDGNKSDDWFYDYYDFADNRRAASDTGSPAFGPSDAAGSPYASSRNLRPSEGAMIHERYYDEPWFYDNRETGFGMPVTTVQDPRFFSWTTREGDSIVGQIQRMKHVRNRSTGGQNMIVQIKPDKGEAVIADLGPIRPLADLGMTGGDRIRVIGHREDVGRYSVLMADRVAAGVNSVYLDRDPGRTRDDRRQLSGRIEEFRDVRVRETGLVHRTGALRTSDGRLAIVDFGPSDASNVPANASPGDPMLVIGRVFQVGQYPVLFADGLSHNGGVPVAVKRSDDIARPAMARAGETRPFESSERITANDPTCIGGGCETPDRVRMRNPLSNAMDGSVRGTQR
jgi:hypothetical protein